MRWHRIVAAGIAAGWAIPAATPAQTRPAGTVERLPLVQQIVRPAQVVRRADGVFFVDFGRAAFGAFELELPQPEAGRKVTVRLGEKLAGPDQVDRKPPGTVRFLETPITLREGIRIYRAALPEQDRRLMPAATGPVMPFRYAELEGLPEGATAAALREGAVRQVAVHYPFDDSAAAFSCSDEKLNAVWELCRYSMKATSFGGVFVDGDRERKPYEADAYINQLGWYCTTTDLTLPRYTHEYLVRNPTWPTEWIMFSVMTGWADWQYTGQTASLAVFYDDLRAKTLRALAREDGLISTRSVPAEVQRAIHLGAKPRDIVDWPAGERDGCEMKDINTVVNAFHCHVLGLMGQLAAALGKDEDAADFRRAAGKATASLNARLADPRTGLYVDGEGSTHSSLHANMFPLAFGLVPAERREKVAAFVLGRRMACSVYGAQFLLEGLFDNGRSREALALMVAPGDRSWRHMVEDVGTTITLEAWDTKYKPNQDWNHAWGAAPANILPRKVLGVEPLEPGYARVRVWPRTGNLAWAKGRVPTVKGPITVDWKQQGATFRMMLELPAGLKAEVGLPGRGPAKLDGREVPGQKREDAPGTVFVEAGGGRHELEIGG